ncbi:MAG: hypothetical protein EA395_05360, partial [Phormidium sp. GEM2.Bin31]
KILYIRKLRLKLVRSAHTTPPESFIASRRLGWDWLISQQGIPVASVEAFPSVLDSKFEAMREDGDGLLGFS